MKVFRPAAFGRGVQLAGTGSYLPPRVVTNADLVAMGAPMTEDEMERLSGITSRHWVNPEQATSDLAVEAGRLALSRAGLAPERIERLIVATVSPDHSSPSTACLAHHHLGLRPVPAMDLSASCSGFLYALDAAARAVATGDDCVLAIAADIRSRYLDVTDRATCALFADGAGAAILTPGPVDTGLIGIGLMAEGSGAHSIHVPAGGSREPATAESVAARRHTIRMADGPQIYLSAVEGMLLCAESLLADLGLTFDDIDLMIPHQANHHILKRVAWKARFPMDKVYINIDRVGNISGATTAVGLDEALASGRAGVGSKILLVAAGAGYTGGAALIVVDEALAARYPKQ